MLKINKIKKELDRNDQRCALKFFLWILWCAFGMISTVWAADEQVVYDAHGRRDPFVPLITATTRESTGLLGIESLDQAEIEGIVYDPKNGSVVIISGTVLKEGEELGAFKVLKIKSDGALLSLNGNQVFKTLYQEDKDGKQKHARAQ